jgi:hypothetical protein
MKVHLTCNQAMVLLDVYRGTFKRDNHVGAVEQDIEKLIRNGLVTGAEPRILPSGEDRVKEMLG